MKQRPKKRCSLFEDQSISTNGPHGLSFVNSSVCFSRLVLHDWHIDLVQLPSAGMMLKRNLAMSTILAVFLSSLLSLHTILEDAHKATNDEALNTARGFSFISSM